MDLPENLSRIEELILSVNALKEQLEIAIEIFEMDPECSTYGTAAFDWLHTARGVIGQLQRENNAP